MVQSCSAYGCRNRYHKDKNISFHKFPLARPDICRKWVAAMKRNNFKPTKYSNICSQHFTKDCFKQECNNRVLKENAVPSLFSRFDEEKERSEDLELQEVAFPSALSLPSADQMEAQQPQQHQNMVEMVLHPALLSSMSISCDHNYTVEDTVQQKKRIQQLEEQVEKLRKKLKTMQQRCRRQEQQLERMKAVRGFQVERWDPSLEESYVILPKELYDILKGIESIGSL
ncbi:THAP domain-containing protein 1-like [Megalops cyprinoides]|uniref:THAP domain-containing protein 1-like n=1 Tax=Megalops cyprinoides TaxID=118141 RepID=UPI001863ADBF|nr:THAP domain-containing protein 1-like [Megalops cyprinoides]